MKTIPEGTLKYLLFNEEEVRRNIQRRNGGGPTVLVAEVTPDVRGGLTFHSGYALLVRGPSASTAQQKPLLEYPTGYLGRRVKVRAALATDAEVRLTESADETLDAPKPTKAQAKPKATPTTTTTESAE